ncbi:MAG TPA: hypothetical protein VN635_08130 [Conexibacter sp.]|nr:hypothetical protein [Conexibacter sp.]
MTAWVPLMAWTSTESARAATPVQVVFGFQGRLWGEEDFYGFISVARPFGYTGHLSWAYEWLMTCATTTPAFAAGAQLSCTGPVRIDGWVKETFVDPLVGESCTAKITSQANAQWGVGAFLRSPRSVRISASPPDVIANSPDPPGSGCQPDEAIQWHSDPNVNATVPLTGGGAVAHAHGSGTYVTSSPQGSTVRGHTGSWSFMDMHVIGTSSSNPASSLTNLSGSIAQNLSGMRDQLSSAIPDLPRLPAPLTYARSSGTLSGQGAAAGRALFTIRQRVRPGMRQVAVRLTAAGRSWLARAGAAKLRISLTFRPKHGHATTIHAIVALSPPIPRGASH